MDSTYHIETFGADWDRLPEAFELTYEVLMVPFGVAREVAAAHVEREAVHVAALGASGGVVGYLRLLPMDAEGWTQVRQVAVADALQGRGLGRALMEHAEHSARGLGAAGVWLNARSSAIGFYERLGYVIASEEFITGLADLPHRRMTKSLR